MSKLRIAIWHNLPSGGGKRALYDQVRGLLERGHHVEAWCPPTADLSYLPLRDLIEEHCIPLNWRFHVAHGQVSRIVSAYHNENVIRQIKAMERHCQACAEDINTGRFDLLLAHPCQFLRVTAIGRHVKIPKVIYLQEPYRWLYEAMPNWPWAAMPAAGKNWWKLRSIARSSIDLIRTKWRRIQSREEIKNAQSYDAILVNSLFSRENILRAYGLDAKVCYLGVDTKTFVHWGLGREFFIVGMGALVPEKNVEFLITALATVKRPRPRLYWIGNVARPDYLEKLKELARSFAIDFEPLIRISDSKVVDLLNRALMFIYAPRLEPFGYAPLEASACGTPVVAVAEGGVRETVIDGVNGLLVEYDPHAMGQAIQHLIDHRDYAQQLGLQGRQMVVERWPLGAALDRLEQRFREVLEKCGRVEQSGC